MIEAVRARFWWPNQKKDIQDFCRGCHFCDRFKNPVPSRKAPLQSMRVGYPNEIVGIDIMGPLPETRNGNRYIIVMVDYFTKWMEAAATQTIDASTVADVIFDRWICQWGAPCQLHSDQGSSFESNVILELCKLLQIDKTRTTAYHPQGNGLVERTNRTIKNLLKAVVEETVQWDKSLSKVTMAYRCTVHSSTGQTPHFLWTGREMRLPSDLQAPYTGRLPRLVTEYANVLKENLIKSHQLARIHLDGAWRRQKEYFDKKAHGTPLEVGDKVLLQVTSPKPGVPTKLHHEWQGPFIVEKVLTESLYSIRRDNPQGVPLVVHFNRLKPIHSDPPDPTTHEVATDVPEVGAEVTVG
jgi:hypothetical protein